MEWRAGIRSVANALLVGEADFILESRVPDLTRAFDNVDALGLYLHIPFCRQICPYCPYNKELYRPETAHRYARAVIREVDRYAELWREVPVTSFYIGGGTPTTMLHSGLDEILSHIFRSFNMQCGVHIEAHPNDLSQQNLEHMRKMGVDYLSVGVEALQDRHLRALHRPYTVDHIRKVLLRARAADFRCINADIIFALPGQTLEEIADAGHELVDMGVDQVAAYPLFTFPYTGWPSLARRNGYRANNIFQKRRMLSVLERIFYGTGFRRTSVWAFTRPGVEKYCSVTVPLYVGLGASGGSYLRDVLYFNTFDVDEYIRALNAGRSPIALSMALSPKMQMAGWLYWRIYETAFDPTDFEQRFGLKLREVYAPYFKLFSMLGFIEENSGQIVLSDAGAYWLHTLQDLFSIDYISSLWEASRGSPWPDRVVL
jgi:coproporphyrinogen III oxidase-like Fe-S oxidoreductase